MEKKQKRVVTKGGQKQPREANKTTGKWFPFMVSSEELQDFVNEKLMAANLESPRRRPAPMSTSSI